MASTTKTGTGTYQVRYRDPNGAQKKKNFTVRREAKAYELEIESRLQKSIWYDPDGLKATLDSFADPWLKGLTNAPQTREDYRRAYRLYVAPVLGSMALKNIDRKVMKDFAIEMATNEYASDTVRKTIGVVAQVIDSAYETLRITDRQNPARRLKLPSTTSVPKLFLNKEQIEKLAAAIAKPKYAGLRKAGFRDQAFALFDEGKRQIDIMAELGVSSSTANYYAKLYRGETALKAKPYPEMALLVRFSCLTGLRAGELAALRPKDIDFDRAKVTVAFSLSKLSIEMQEELGVESSILRKGTKTDRTRTVPIPKFLLPGLQALADQRDGDEDYLFQMPEGGPLNQTNLLRRFLKPAAVAVGLPALRWHDLRHTYAALLIDKGANIMVVCQRMGHSKPTVTLNIYGHIFPDADEAVTAALEADWADSSN